MLVQDENAAPVRKEIKCNRIKVLMGMHSYYLYDETLMTDNYARWAFLAAEDNPVVTFVECVREDSRVYPRPYAAECLKNPPFRMTDEQIEETWQAVRDSGNYPDIERTEHRTATCTTILRSTSSPVTRHHWRNTTQWSVLPTCNAR